MHETAKLSANKGNVLKLSLFQLSVHVGLSNFCSERSSTTARQRDGLTFVRFYSLHVNFTVRKFFFEKLNAFL